MRQLGRRSPNQRGQALVEFGLITPAILLLVLLTVDLGRAYYQAIDAAGAARAGARIGIISDTSDIGGSIRTEPNTGIPNTDAAWGSVGPSAPQGTCTVAAAMCGDPSGCVSSSFSGTQIACFAIRSCTLSGGGDLGTCTSYGPWGYRPESGGGHGLQVRVVIEFSPATPALPSLVPPNGIIYIVQNATGEELYF
jgi:hypothetical protein